MMRGVAVSLGILLAMSAGAVRADGGLDFGDLDQVFDVVDDPIDLASDLDVEFEADDIIGLNLSAQSLSLLGSRGFRVTARRRLSTLQLMLFSIRAPLGLPVLKALDLLRGLDPGGFYDTNSRYALAGDAGTVSACDGIRCYGRELIGWPRGCNAQVRIGMVDSAVDGHHPALAGARVEQKRFAKGRALPDHGTAVAALLVGSADNGFAGLLPKADLYAADIFSAGDDGVPVTDTVRLVIGLDWVASNQPTVVNLSIAGPGGSVLATAISRLQQAGIMVVAAAGNGGPGAAPRFPAAYPDVVAVTAVDRHLHVYASASRGDYLSVAAPGVDVWAPASGDAGAFRQGTSFAAPFAAAAVAVARLHHPQWAPAVVRESLQRAARDLGDPGFDPVFGWGLLQAEACAGADPAPVSGQE